MSAVEQTKEVVDLAVGYTKQIVEALTPVAKQAYEIGLVTLQIDAAQSLLLSAACVAGWAFVTLWLVKDYKAGKIVAQHPDNKYDTYRRSPSYHMPGEGCPHIVAFVLTTFLGVLGSFKILSIWAWVKLFQPELWLAHMAVEKIIK